MTIIDAPCFLCHEIYYNQTISNFSEVKFDCKSCLTDNWYYYNVELKQLIPKVINITSARTGNKIYIIRNPNSNLRVIYFLGNKSLFLDYLPTITIDTIDLVIEKVFKLAVFG